MLPDRDDIGSLVGFTLRFREVVNRFMLSTIIKLLLILVGLINFIPVIGVFSAEHLNTLYSIEVTEPNLLILMRHRALLFGIVGGIIIFSAFRPALQPLAIVVGLISMIGFIVIANQADSYNDLIRRVIWADVVAIVILLLVIILTLIDSNAGFPDPR